MIWVNLLYYLAYFNVLASCFLFGKTKPNITLPVTKESQKDFQSTGISTKDSLQLNKTSNLNSESYANSSTKSNNTHDEIDHSSTTKQININEINSTSSNDKVKVESKKKIAENSVEHHFFWKCIYVITFISLIALFVSICCFCYAVDISFKNFNKTSTYH